MRNIISTLDVTTCSPAIMGVGGPSVGAAAVPAASCAKKGCGGNGGNPPTDSILIDFHHKSLESFLAFSS
jgi:hypothetical protein